MKFCYGSIILIYGCDPDPAFFVSDLEDIRKIIFFSSKFLCLLLFVGTFT
jgi:hypothetical protein